MTMTDTELEDRVVATLRAKSAQVQVAPREFDPDLVALTPLAARGRRRVPVLVAAVVALVVAIAIGVALVLVDQRESTEPAGEPSRPVSQMMVISLDSLSYSAAEYTTEPGLNEIEFVSSGTHTLTFADPSLHGFQLSSSEGRAVRGTVELQPGRDYVIQCVIPGHQRAGETATIHVTSGPPGPTRGSISAVLGNTAQVTVGGGVIGPDPQANEPDYVQIDTYRGRPVYVKRLDYLSAARAGLVPAFAEDLTTVVGHRDPMRGFIPLGTDPASRSDATTTPPPSTSP